MNRMNSRHMASYCQQECARQLPQQAPNPPPDMGYKPWGGAAAFDAGARRAEEEQLRDQQIRNMQLQNELLEQQMQRKNVEEKRRTEQQRSVETPSRRSNFAGAERDFSLAKNLWIGAGGYTKDRAKSIQHLQSAAADGYPPALFVLGRLYRSGGEVQMDKERGRYLIQRAADAGYKAAADELAKIDK